MPTTTVTHRATVRSQAGSFYLEPDFDDAQLSQLEGHRVELIVRSMEPRQDLLSVAKARAQAIEFLLKAARLQDTLDPNVTEDDLSSAITQAVDAGVILLRLIEGRPLEDL